MRTIRGGRSTVRHALDMATLVATRHNPTLKAHYQKLLDAGKKKTVALIACMRKFLARDRTTNCLARLCPKAAQSSRDDVRSG